MNKKIKVVTILSIVTGLVLLNIITKENTIINETTKIEKNKNMLTMMLETEAGTGNYEEVTQSGWPQDGYVFNASLSRCENGGTLSWDDDAKKVIMQTNESDKCYIYFDIKDFNYLSEYIIKNLFSENGESNGLYHHDDTLAIGALDNSYRYSGANPNNYVCFGSDVAICPEDNLYRIIGLFDDDEDNLYNIKLIKNKSVGTYYWSGSSTNRVNDWELSTLNVEILNGIYLNNLGNWSTLIMENNWSIGGMKNDNDYASKDYYNYEVGNSSYLIKNKAKIGLMYISDFGFASKIQDWTVPLSNSKNLIDANNNWMLPENDEWTITRHSSATTDAFVVWNNGYVGTDGLVGSYMLNVRPCFYLNSDVTYVSGSGTQSDPFRIA